MVDHEKLAVVLAEFARTLLTEFPIQAILDHLVDRIVEVLPITGAGVTLIANDGDPHYISASDDDALRFERLQSETGEGPCVAAYESSQSVSVADLRLDGRFPVFGPQAVAAGLLAVFTLPLRHDDGCLGALDLYRDSPGALDDADLRVAQTLADVATAYLLNARARDRVRSARDQFKHISLYDPLTGLPNRRLLQERIEQAAQRARRTHSTAAVLFVDLDRFKLVNDTHGHQTGDELLSAVAHRLSGLIRSGDTLARVSGDEFVFLCEEMSGASDAELLAARVNEVFTKPFVLRGIDTPLLMTASVGIAYTGPGSEISDQLIVEADMAMYQVKRDGGSGHQIIDMRKALIAMDLNSLEQDLRAALAADELEVAYQPIIRNPAGPIAGVEALLRWTHPQRGPIPPPTIIRVAEQTGMIAELGAWVLTRGCRDHARWLADNPTIALHLAVNVSARQLLDPEFPQLVASILEQTDTDPASLILEVTESIFIEDDGDARRILTELDDLGVRLALDDFGTGYSSLSYLCRLPIHIVKIDRSFISDLDRPATMAIVTAIAGLAHDLDLDLVAEGIETQDQADQVNALGCQYSQGFFIAKPMSAAAMAAQLAGGTGPNESGPQPTAQPTTHVAPSQIVTKRTLTVLSHALEELAAVAGPGATVLALFTHGAHFVPMVDRYERMARAGATVIIGFVGPGPVARGAHMVELGATHELRNEWSLLVIAPDLAAHVVAVDLMDFDPSEATLEAGRRFTGEWGFNRLDTADHLERVVSLISGSLDAKTNSHLATVIRTARRQRPTPAERGMAAAARVLIDRVEAGQKALSTLRTSLASETELATQDPLTGLLNRNGLTRWLGGPEMTGIEMPAIGVVMLDLDRFKQINDEHGHLAGDKVLTAVAEALQSSTRPGDVVVRWGGDEFVVLCPGAEGDQLVQMADRLRSSIADVNIDGVTISASAGLQVCNRRPLVLAAADNDLYAAKALRNEAAKIAAAD